ncbi:MAG TPA: M28 family peptidase [Gemmatimonadaceae bacterium]|nr:M28 family peptidase [Gemmatimonadaceae bacterium]
MADTGIAQRAKDLLDRLSETTRFAGSLEESAARAICRRELEGAGFVCSDIPFEFSDWPARWGPPVSAAVQLAILLTVISIAKHGEPGVALAALILAAVLLGWIGGQVKRRGVLSFRYGRTGSSNLVAVRGEPRVWLVAHLDSKSQTIPMLVRIVSSVALQLASIAVAVALVTAMVGVVVPRGWWLALQLIAVTSAVPSVVCLVGNRSTGAVDNASGVVAVVLAATAADSRRGLGVLVTSAEELGLAGARAWATTAASNIKVLNCDTLDDSGGWHCMYSGAEPRQIAAATRAVAASAGLSLRIGKLIPGILADNIAFADAHVEAVTLSRGNFSTLARIHTWRDNSIALSGQGAAEAAAFLSALAKELG